MRMPVLDTVPTPCCRRISSPHIMPDELPATLGPGDMTGTWMTAAVMLHREKRVASALGACDGVGWYLPQYRERRVYQKVSREIRVPLFPRYLFVCIADDAGRYAALDVKRRLSRYFYKLTEVNNQSRLIEHLKVVHLATQRDEIRPYRVPVVGQMCEVVRGPYEGTRGVVIRGGERPKFVIQPTEGMASELAVAPEDLEIIETKVA